jgi:hypothetical protein
MAEEWRVSLILDGRGGTSHCRDLLRSRFGDDIVVSAEKAHIFLYAGSEKAAGEAEYVAREVLAQQDLNAEFRVECWDPPCGGWRDPEEPVEHDDKPGPGRLRTTATALLKGAAQAASYGDF